MPLFDVKFNVLNGGLGRVLAGDDSVSGFIFPSSANVLPVKNLVFYSLLDAENAGFGRANAPEVHYHVANFYDQVAAPLYVTFSEGDYDQDLHDLQALADGKIKQIAVIDHNEFAINAVAQLNISAEQASAEHKGYSVLYTAVFSGQTLSTLPDLTEYNYPKVSVVIGADQGNKDYSCIGATLGTVASAKVSNCIGYVKAFNAVKTGEFEKLGFATGEDYASATETLLSQVKDKGYIFLRKYTGRAGSFHSDSATVVSPTSDFATIENNRTMEKAQRGIYTALVDELGSPLTVAEDGKLHIHTIAHFDLLVRNVLESMKDNGELSAFAITIDPNQPVLSTSTLEIKVGIVPLGVARQIVVPIGFQLNLTA